MQNPSQNNSRLALTIRHRCKKKKKLDETGYHTAIFSDDKAEEKMGNILKNKILK